MGGDCVRRGHIERSWGCIEVIGDPRKRIMNSLRREKVKKKLGFWENNN